jgi:hypothetical protein
VQSRLFAIVKKIKHFHHNCFARIVYPSNSTEIRALRSITRFASSKLQAQSFHHSSGLPLCHSSIHSPSIAQNPVINCAPWQQPKVIQHSQRLLRSFQQWTGRSLLPNSGSAAAIAQALFEASFVVVSHGTEVDPILNYGNRHALELWEMTWDTLTRTPSRQTAELIARAERDLLLQQARDQGYIGNYQGIRISSTGKRFWIQDVIIWDVLDEANQRIGQAATFERWEFLPGG